MRIDAMYLDRDIYDYSFAKSRWYIHSIFKNSFNLQAETKKQLVVVSIEQKNVVPNGIYVDQHSFKRLTSEIKINDLVWMDRHSLRFGFNILELIGQQYQTKLIETTKLLDSNSVSLLLTSLEKVEKKTGYHESLSSVSVSGDPFLIAIDHLCSSHPIRQRQALQFLIGRGPGLTPSGDDMIVGHLAARFINKKRDQVMETYLGTKLMTINDLTTDVSLHYLLCSLDQRFNRSIIALISALINDEPSNVQNTIQEILNTGHTSGADFLAGFTRSIKNFTHEKVRI